MVCDDVLVHVDLYQAVYEHDASIFVLEKPLFCLEDRGSMFHDRYYTTVTRFTLKRELTNGRPTAQRAADSCEKLVVPHLVNELPLFINPVFFT
jgi:hypothetical protein